METSSKASTLRISMIIGAVLMCARSVWGVLEWGQPDVVDPSAADGLAVALRVATLILAVSGVGLLALGMRPGTLPFAALILAFIGFFGATLSIFASGKTAGGWLGGAALIGSLICAAASLFAMLAAARRRAN